MLELSSNTRVAELQDQSPAMMDALMATGIFRAGDDPETTIGELCWGFGLNPIIILRTLAKAQAKEAPSDIDVSELDGLTMTQVVENIEVLHHAYLRETLPVIGKLVDRVAGVHGASDERLIEIRKLFAKMAEDIENHLLHEEEALFPMVRDMESVGSIKPTRCGDAVGGPITCMENDHELMQAELKKLQQLTDNYAVPEHACMTYRNMLEQLGRFSQDMVVHIHKEDKVLFPGAIKLQAALRKSR
ncbi:MAG: hemerythrin domain-containing protein [Gammaproteobacteria bacterium]|jgi:regulator of cell morphogenesis and NO signaling|nr:iron-sulfur cluster repair di-iron protein [Gammaproteobacteria bacterium]MDP7154182.1 hemerythrin domain-containing protein [Gammaproteobacteria bacterium]MDP7297228.1 hemerythrin domain-containing protein [Gammaproteobacteria bacterium]MDP7419805.1 hemerythrin domain-containing protein [Gammaproteobacteria bacterium]HJP38565.1 hemerythrin domain-containing protein [Gammaproteobacteria bacterium]